MAKCRDCGKPACACPGRAARVEAARRERILAALREALTGQGAPSDEGAHIYRLGLRVTGGRPV